MSGEAMDPELRKAVERRFGYREWRGRSALPETLFLWKHRLRPDDLPGWRPERAERIELPAVPPALHGVWQPDDEGRGRMIVVDAIECPSQDAAHEALLDLLATFQLGQIAGPDDIPLGDVGFAAPSRAAVAFARANLVLSVRSAGTSPIEVVEPASALDAAVAARPTVSVRAAPPRVRAGRRAEAPDEVMLDVDLPDAGDAPVSYKLFAPGGEIRLDDGGRLVYRPSPTAPGVLTVFALPAGAEPAPGRAEIDLGDLA